MWLETSYHFVNTYISMISPFALGYNTLTTTNSSASTYRRDSSEIPSDSPAIKHCVGIRHPLGAWSTLHSLSPKAPLCFQWL